VTRSLQWIRIRADDKPTSGSGGTSPKEFELLDSPGVIPAKMVDQSDALLLAACNCIGQAAYDNQAVAAYLCEWLKAIHLMDKQHLTAPEWRVKCKERYGFDPLEPITIEETALLSSGHSAEGTVTRSEYLTGEDMLFRVADNTCRGDPEDAARKILQDFRTGRMGPVSLQLAPETVEDAGQLSVDVGDHTILGRQRGTSSSPSSASWSAAAAAKEGWERSALDERARAALATAKERGLELPPVVDSPGKVDEAAVDAGKGMFEGW
jgi:ribosome biogenesis GTPase A